MIRIALQLHHSRFDLACSTLTSIVSWEKLFPYPPVENMASSRFLFAARCVPFTTWGMAARLHVPSKNETPDTAGMREKLVNFGFKDTNVMRVPDAWLGCWWEKIQFLIAQGVSGQDVVNTMGNLDRRSWIQNCSLKKLEEAMEFMRTLKFSNHQMLSMLYARSSILSYRSNTRKRKMEFLETLGIDQGYLETIIKKCPVVLALKSANIQASVAVLLDIGMTESQLHSLIARYPAAIGGSAQRNVRAILEVFQGSEGISKELICKLLVRQPNALGYSVELFSAKMQLLDQLGLAKGSKALLVAFIELSTMSCSSIQEKFTFLVSLGFSECQVVEIVTKMPAVLKRSKEALSRNMSYLTDILRVDLEQIVKSPSLLSLSLEKRIIPRIVHFARLREEGILQREYKLITMLLFSEKEFKMRFIDGVSKRNNVLNLREV